MCWNGLRRSVRDVQELERKPRFNLLQTSRWWSLIMFSPLCTTPYPSPLECHLEGNWFASPPMNQLIVWGFFFFLIFWKDNLTVTLYWSHVFIAVAQTLSTQPVTLTLDNLWVLIEIFFRSCRPCNKKFDRLLFGVCLMWPQSSANWGRKHKRLLICVSQLLCWLTQWGLAIAGGRFCSYYVSQQRRRSFAGLSAQPFTPSVSE